MTLLLNAFASHVCSRLVSEYPDWHRYVATLPGGDLECAVPAPAHSQAGHLVVFTSKGQHLWVRYALPQMCYPLDTEDEMLTVVDQLMRDEALFVVTREGDESTGTTLMRPGQEPDVPVGQVADVVSWSGTLDRTIVNRR